MLLRKKSQDLGPKPGSSKTLSDSDDDLPLVEVLGLPGKNVNYGLTDSPEGAQTKLDADDKVVITSVFKTNIEAGQFLTKHQVRSKMCTNSHLRKYVVHKAKVEKIVDFLNYETNHVCRLKHREDDFQEEGSAVITLTSGSWREWNMNSTDANTIQSSVVFQ